MKIFLDVGAHYGETAKIALQAEYGFDKLYCFEPVRECCDEIQKINDNRIVVCNFGLWNETRRKTLYAPKERSASLFEDKTQRHKITPIKVALVKSSGWFKQNLNTNDEIYLKLNCEGAECAILDDLINSGEYKKITVLMVDFDVRKIPSQKHLMNEMKLKLSSLNIPRMYFIDEYNLGKGTHSSFTHYWLSSSNNVNWSEQSPLCRLAFKYGTDKCPQIKHSYTPYYYKLFEDKKNSIKKVLEMGIGYYEKMSEKEVVFDKGLNRYYFKGASLKMWRDFFPNAQIYGADIRPEAMFSDTRIKTFLCDELNTKEVENLINQIGTDIDIFIDDASHHWKHQAHLAKTILPLLKKGVIYIVEDVGHPYHIINELKNYKYEYPKLNQLIKMPKDKLLLFKNN